jgi:hypothetical protein
MRTRIVVWTAAVAMALTLGARARGEALTVTAEVGGVAGYGDGMGVLAIPGQRIAITLDVGSESTGVLMASAGAKATASVAEQYEWSATGGTLADVMGRRLTYQCPKESGNQTVTVRCVKGVTLKGADGADVSSALEATWSLRVFVQYPYDREGRGLIESFPIGVYPDENGPRAPSTVKEAASSYHPPKWFAKVGKDQRATLISPHFKIGEFCSPYSEADPTFVAVAPRLIERLESARARLVAPDRPDPRLVILRAFLSPNEADQLRRKGLALTEFSRHLYGDAVAVIVDQDNDGVMDDLNADGKADLLDVDYLSRVFEQIERETRSYGGLGIHAGPTDPLLPKTPYLSVDCRGKRARWSSSGGRRTEE